MNFFLNIIFIILTNNIFSNSLKLIMNYDYNIIQQLKINYKNEKIFSIIELSNEYAYFYKSHLYDEEEDYYHYKMLQFYDKQLIPKKDPEIIYFNGSFVQDFYKNQYNEKINKIIQYNNKNLEDISEISKVEIRIRN